jgi:hypothetical protein
MFIGDDGDYRRMEEMKKEGKYVFATCYDIDWGFLIPCESGVYGSVLMTPTKRSEP